MNILVSDIGYGDTKYIVLQDGQETRGKMPTLVAPVMKTTVDLGEDDSLFYGGRHYFVGDDAKFANYVIPTTTRDFLPLHSPLIVAEIMRQHEIEDLDLLVVSLSLKDWGLKNELVRSMETFTVSGKTYSQEVKVFPQGMGIWVECGRPEEVAIVDIGYNTIDVPVFRRGRINRKLSFAIGGMGTVAFLSEVAEYVNNSFKEELTANEICYLMQTETPYFKKMGLQDEIKKLAMVWFNDLWERLESRPVFKEVCKYMDVVIAGGGARFAASDVLGPGVRVLDRDPEFANVSGFAKEIKREVDW